MLSMMTGSLKMRFILVRQLLSLVDSSVHRQLLRMLQADGAGQHSEDAAQGVVLQQAGGVLPAIQGSPGPAGGPSAASSARGRGATPSSAAASAGAGQPAEQPYATADDFWDFQQEMQAEAARVRELEADLAATAAAEAAAEAATGDRSRWGQRCEEEEGRWRTRAPSIGAAVLQLYAAPEPEELCGSCQAPGCTIRCSTCCLANGVVYLCEACDKQQHHHMHMHTRQEYSNSCWEDLPLADPVNGYFMFRPILCNKCHGTDISGTVVKTQALDYITLGGVIKARRAAYACGNPECRAAVWQQPEQFVSVGAWPASLDDEHLRTIIAQNLLQMYDALKLRAPTMSLDSFVQALADASWHNNLQQPWQGISTSVFRRAAEEYSSCQLDLRLGIKHINDLDCPACSGGNCAYHVDSNMKLFVWQRNRQPWREPHFREFFAESADVQGTLQAVDIARLSRE